MAAEDFFESEVALAAAATAAAFSPRVRGAIRQGLVYGVAGVTTAARAVAGAAETVGRGVVDVLPVGGGSASNGRARRTVASPARPAASPARATRARTSRSATTPRARSAAKRPAAARAKATASPKADPAAPPASSS